MYKSSSFQIQNFKLLAIFCDGTDQFVGPVRRPHCWFSHGAAQMSEVCFVVVSRTVVVVSRTCKSM